MIAIEVVRGNLLDQDVDVIVNPWNRNLIPWWLLIPRGVSGAIKARGGIQPFRELRCQGVIPPGGAVLTSAGRLPFRGIIHVAGINLLWTATERSIRDSTRNAVHLAAREGFRSIAIPLIGSGTGRFDPERTEGMIVEELKRAAIPTELSAMVVIFQTGR